VAVAVAMAVAGWQCVVWVGCVIASILIGDNAEIGAKLMVAVWLGGRRRMRTSSRRPDPVSGCGCGRLCQMAVVVAVAVAVAGWQCVVWLERVSASILIGDKVEIDVAVAGGSVAGWQ
jgi:hypothetical protein